MIYEKLAILTDGKETSLKVIELFNPYMSVDSYELLCYDIILIDTTSSIQDWTELIKRDLNIDVKVMLVEDLKFSDDAPEGLPLGLETFIKKADISYDINYFLDLIIEKGDRIYLTGKERQRLKELSQNI
jgi:hypothetical protein